MSLVSSTNNLQKVAITGWLHVVIKWMGMLSNNSRLWHLNYASEGRQKISYTNTPEAS